MKNALMDDQDDPPGLWSCQMKSLMPGNWMKLDEIGCREARVGDRLCGKRLVLLTVVPRRNPAWFAQFPSVPICSHFICSIFSAALARRRGLGTAKSLPWVVVGQDPLPGRIWIGKAHGGATKLASNNSPPQPQKKKLYSAEMTSDVGKWPVSCRYCSIKNLELDHVDQSCRSSSWLSKLMHQRGRLAGRWLSKSEDIGRISFLWVYIEYRQIPTYLSCCYLIISDHVSTNRLELLKHIFFERPPCCNLGEGQAAMDPPSYCRSKPAGWPNMT